ncbi:hypothetical protein ACPV56_10400 [Vibrio astriarenae]
MNKTNYYYSSEVNKHNIKELIKRCNNLQSEHRNKHNKDDAFVKITKAVLISFFNPKEDSVQKALLYNELKSVIDKYNKNNPTNSESDTSLNLDSDASSTPQAGTEPSM